METGIKSQLPPLVPQSFTARPKYQIFISSTYEDLKAEREQVIKTILGLGHIPIGMEMFNAANETQWELIKRRIEESDYYIVIIAHRYGSIEMDTGLSYTEKEYDYANSIGVPTYAFVLDRKAQWPGDMRDEEPKKQSALKKFIAKVEGKIRASWSNKDELAAKLSLSLTEAFNAYPRAGWVRANQAVSPEIANEMARLSSENAELRTQLEQARSLSISRQTPVVEVDFCLETFMQSGETQHALLIRARNVGKVRAEHVKCRVTLHWELMPNYKLSRMNRSFELTDTCTEFFDNTTRDVVGTSQGRAVIGPPTYGPSRYDPILPSDFVIWTIELTEAWGHREFDIEKQKIRWSLSADDAEPKEGEAILSELPKTFRAMT